MRWLGKLGKLGSVAFPVFRLRKLEIARSFASTPQAKLPHELGQRPAFSYFPQTLPPLRPRSNFANIPHAKRQGTWFRNQWPEIPTWDPDTEPVELAFIRLGLGA